MCELINSYYSIVFESSKSTIFSIRFINNRVDSISATYCDPVMGNTSGNQRHKSAGLIAPSSPTKEVQSQAFVFDKNSDSNALHEANPLFTKNTSKPNVW